MEILYPVCVRGWLLKATGLSKLSGFCKFPIAIKLGLLPVTVVGLAYGKQMIVLIRRWRINWQRNIS